MAKKENDLKMEIARVELYLKDLKPDSKEYETAVKNLKVLYEAKQVKKDAAWIPNPDNVLAAFASLVQIFTILNYEEANVIATKALQFLFKPKLVN